MLVLSRKVGEEIVIGDGIVVKLLQIQGERVQLGFEADQHIPIYRKELLSRHDSLETVLSHASAATA